MNNHNCDTLLVTCIDFRFQEYIDKFIKEKVGVKNHDRVAWAGGIKDLEKILGQIDISNRLHHIHKVVLINHEDCGAYGEAGTEEKHREDLKNALEAIKSRYPHLQVELYYLKLDGTFNQFN